MVYVRSVDGDQPYDNRRRRNHWPESEYSHSDAGSEYYYSQDGSRRNYGGAAATRFNPYSYSRRAYDSYGSGHRAPQVRTYSLGDQQPLGIDRLRALSSRGYRQRYYEDDERLMPQRYDDPRMMREPYLSRSTYPRFLVPGWGHILIGMFLFIMGITDIGYTASKFEDDCEYDGTEFDPGPCQANHVYTYVASPVWGGIFMIMTGAMTFWMNPYRLRYNDWLLKSFCGLAVFLFLAVCPGIIVLNVLEITQNENTFWKEGSGITLADEPKFAFPVVIVILAFVEWVVALISICICICCPPMDLNYTREPKYLPEPFIRPDYRPEASREPVVIHEEVIQPPRRDDGYARRAYSDVMTRPTYRDEIIPRPAIMPGPSYKERGPVVVHEEIIPGTSRSRRDDDVYSVYTDASMYSRGGRRGRTNYGYARSEDYGRSYYY